MNKGVLKVLTFLRPFVILAHQTVIIWFQHITYMKTDLYHKYVWGWGKNR